MCQMNVMVDKQGNEEIVLENVTQLEVVEDGVMLSTFFEEPKLISGVAVKTIDFLSGKLILEATEKV